jgi:L-malate glycosyltransferase
MLARQMLAFGNGSKPRRLPFVTTLHGTDITLVGLDPSYLPITRFSIEQSDGVTAISNYLREKTLQEFEIKRHIEVIPNFVNCDLYHPTPNATELRLEYARPDERLLVHLSNFRPVKRICDVIEIFARVNDKIPSRLMMMGDGPERSKAEWLARKLNVHDRVHFMGKQDRVHEKLGIADVLLMPSQLESFGLAALEAMACEVVPVATNVGGVPEVIEHGRTGFLANVGDIDEMARCAIDVLSDDAKLTEIRKRARIYAQSRYCSTKIIPKYEEFYRGVLKSTS